MIEHWPALPPALTSPEAVTTALIAGCALVLALVDGATAQEATVAPPEGIVAEGVPAVPAKLVETAGRYAENRSAFVTSWHPTRREMLIGTRFGNTYQAHLVKQPAGARQQLLFRSKIKVAQAERVI